MDKTHSNDFLYLPYSPAEIIERLLVKDQRLLLVGASRKSKSSLIRLIAGFLKEAGRSCRLLCADPGASEFGIPGAVCLGGWEDDVLDEVWRNTPFYDFKQTVKMNRYHNETESRGRYRQIKYR